MLKKNPRSDCPGDLKREWRARLQVERSLQDELARRNDAVRTRRPVRIDGDCLQPAAFVEAPPAIATAVTVLGIAMSMLGAVLLGVAWPREWFGRCATRLSLRGLALHLTFVPASLALATLVGLDLPAAAWILALGPLPVSIVSFARLYGYSTRTAATGLALSIASALALLPVAIAVGG